MKTRLAASILIFGSGLIAGTVAVANVTREQVKAELADAVRNGDVRAHGETSLTFKELYPSRYTKKQGMSRANPSARQDPNPNGDSK